MATGTEKETEAIPSVKDLASSDPSFRRKSLQEIISHLESRSPSNHLTQTQALQLWRGFHVAVYMHDSKNQLSVQTLIATLASTFRIMRSKDIELRLGSSSTDTKSQAKQVNSNDTDNNEDDEFTGFDDENDDNSKQTTSPQKQSTTSDTTWLSTYTAAFWETIAREWSGVDQWRMNKFLLLTRFVLRETFHICLASCFGIEETEHAPSGNDDTTATATSQSKKRKDTTSTSTKPPSKKAKKSSNTSSSTSTSTPENKPPASDPNPTIQQIHILSTNPLSPRSRTVSDGLRLHILDIYTDELFTVLSALKPALTASFFPEPDAYAERVRKVLSEEFLAPVRNVASEGLARHVRAKAKEVLAEWEERCVEELS